MLWLIMPLQLVSGGDDALLLRPAARRRPQPPGRVCVPLPRHGHQHRGADQVPATDQPVQESGRDNR